MTEKMYQRETEKLLKNIEVYKNGEMPEEIKFKKRKMKVEVLDISTVGAGRMFKNGRTAVLNFANPFGPGAAQEGSLIRASNLYEALISEVNVKNYYEVNYNYDIINPGIYTDTLMYAKNVWFYGRESDNDSWHMDVITCPAPSIKIIPETVEMAIIRHRAECVIKSAILNKVDNLVLGAWGCGVFGQNPEVVSKAFMSVLENYPAFKNVVFAIPDSTSRNYKVFKKNCEEVK